MFVPEVPESALKLFHSPDDKWSLAVTAAASPYSSSSFSSSSSKSSAASGSGGALSTVSFVNNTSTLRGGTHVTYVVDQVAKAVAAHINANSARKYEGVTATPASVRPHIFLFLNAKVANPSFDSQTKELLTSKVRRGGGWMNRWMDGWMDGWTCWCAR